MWNMKKISDKVKRKSLKEPFCLDFMCLCNEYILCCLKTKNYKKYRADLDAVELDLSRNLDLVKWIQRNRMTALRLEFTSETYSRDLSAKLARKRPIKYINMNEKSYEKNREDNPTAQISNISKQESTLVQFTKRYIKIMDDKDQQSPHDLAENSEAQSKN
jgi:hypothetical protein